VAEALIRLLTNLQPQKITEQPAPQHYIVQGANDYPEHSYLTDCNSPTQLADPTGLDKSWAIVYKTFRTQFEGVVKEHPAQPNTVEENAYIYSRENPTTVLGITHGCTLGDGGIYVRALRTNTPPNALVAVQGESKPHNYYRFLTDVGGTIRIYDQVKDVKQVPRPPYLSNWQLGPIGGRKEGYASYPTTCLYFNPDEILLLPISAHKDHNWADQLYPKGANRIPLYQFCKSHVTLADITDELMKSIRAFDNHNTIPKGKGVGVITTTDMSNSNSRSRHTSLSRDDTRRGKGKGGRGQGKGGWGKGTESSNKLRSDNRKRSRSTSPKHHSRLTSRSRDRDRGKNHIKRERS
jgi:hypothetical protein